MDELVTPFGVWLIKQICRVPVIRTLPLGSKFRDCREVVITWRSLYRPEMHAWHDWYIPPTARLHQIWVRR